MNILQIQSALTKLDDNQLKQEMLSPGMAPQFLVLSEMQRRQEIRRGGQKGPPPPQTTLKDEAMAETGAPPVPPPQGIAALPEGAETARGVQGFAGGGPVVINGRVYNEDDLDPDERRILEQGGPIGRYLGAGPTVLRGLYGAATGPVGILAPRPGATAPGPVPGVSLQQRELDIAAQRGQIPPAPVARPMAPGDLSPQPLSDDGTVLTPPQALVPDAPRLSPGTAPAAPDTSAGLPSLRTRPAPSEVDAALAAMPKYPATRTAALIESGLGANTNHGGSFKGFLGVGDAMWKDYRDRLDLKESDRENPEAQRRIYESFAEDQRKANPKLSDSDIYTAWAWGPAAARAARAAPTSDAYATYARLTSKEQADKAFSTNPGLLQPGRTNADTLAAYRARYAMAERGDTVPAGRGPDGTEIRVAPPGSGAAAVAGDSTTPLAFSVKGSDPMGGDKGPRIFEDYMNSARGPDRFAGSEDEARRLFGGNAAEERKNAVNFGLMEAGLRIMGSTSPRLAGAISEGGIAGLQTYRQGLEAARRDEKEGFGARMGIAAARARQDDTAAHTGATLYSADSQAASARGNNATTLQAAQIGADAGIRGHEISAAAQREVAQRNPTLEVLREAARDPAIRDIYIKAQQDPARSEYYLEQAKDVQRRGYLTAYDKLRDDIYGKPGGLPLLPAQKADADARYRAGMAEIHRLYPLFAPPAAAAAPAAANNPLGLTR
jgi:hypothetical protein